MLVRSVVVLVRGCGSVREWLEHTIKGRAACSVDSTSLYTRPVSNLARFSHIGSTPRDEAESECLGGMVCGIVYDCLLCLL